MKYMINFVPRIKIKEFVLADTGEFISHAQLEKEINTTLSKIPNILLEKAEKKGWSCRITNLRNLENEYGYDFKISGLTDYIRRQIVVYATFDGVRYALPHASYVRGNDYWDQWGSFNREAEVYANCFSMSAAGNAEACEFMKEYFPATWNAFQNSL